MTIPAGIVDTLKFILLEVIRQIEDTQKALDQGGDQELIAQIIARDEYIDNLKVYVENHCFSLIYSNSTVSIKAEADLIRAINTITGNLERIADHAVNIARQIPYFANRQFIKDYDYQNFFEIIRFNLKRIHKALFEQDLGLARKICTSESKLDRAYKRAFERILKELAKGKEVENLITTIFVLRYLERIGDCLLNIGEAIIFSVVGEKLKLSQFEFLEDILTDLDDLTIKDIKFAGIWGSRSGCRIGLIQAPKLGNKEFVFKEGLLHKIEEEKTKIELWNQQWPGITPHVLDYKVKGDHASMLVEFIEGDTLQHYLLDSSDSKLEESLGILEGTLKAIWEKTLDPNQKPPCKALAQLEGRIEDVLRVHPNYSQPEMLIGGMKIHSFRFRLEALQEKTKDLVAPFAVLVHGDFNLDNIFFENKTKHLKFIDVHRSDFGDYAADAAVFLISNFRQKVFEPELRSRIERSAARFLAFVRQFARTREDHLFERRLGVGLVRSLITSTRFEFHPDLAETMFQRALYLMDRLMEEKEDHPFEVPTSLFIF
ncbi:MAG: hypothetical protein A2600_04995 [Candidatus Lambdaproteobacteria bacterium RIFOXYD1_FULL_56_27]|uniref:PhoU domain-containing protein n=1 Tax=Candidatus Lambdaproteobacteria bacterium RIFOXYD2_FULL_56_26 TaxID=1817773 RepID=A0A1F6GRS3_9PROT|nr:MAG: hypothetical protein A2426_07850 [Candidatus Lambdaproteobacteria bacterium RIFOXYC1_FULL_56_13]OGH00825.1 MAG: hypothetical protein A2557_03890 [Candidatus Lambdaproteobacteria bacterium RIFOXYD2_FULL_56_26]OGH09910.1 MAG: hypothetical protein A2600_04995 [Candidatus Lambdaproteobacteria bacterium RIFOXYD1_FULL_56_27]